MENIQLLSVGVDLNTTKGYPVLQIKKGNEFAYVDKSKPAIGVKIAYQNSLFDIQEVIEERAPAGVHEHGAVFYRVIAGFSLNIQKGKNNNGEMGYIQKA